MTKFANVCVNVNDIKLIYFSSELLECTMFAWNVRLSLTGFRSLECSTCLDFDSKTVHHSVPIPLNCLRDLKLRVLSVLYHGGGPSRSMMVGCCGDGGHSLVHHPGRQSLSSTSHYGPLIGQE